MAAYYILAPFDRPQTERDFEFFAYAEARRFFGKERNFAKDNRSQEEIADKIRIRSHGGADDLGDDDLLSTRFVHRRVHPVQLDHVHFKDVLRQIEKMPAPYRSGAVALMLAESLLGYAKDQNVSLFDAMKEQQHIRAVLRRVVEDDSDERREANP